MGKQRKAFKAAKDQAAFESWLRSHMENILSIGGMGNFRLRTLLTMENEALAGDACMEISIDHKYFEITLTYELNYAAEQWYSKDYEELLRSLCHECAHIPTEEADSQLIFKSSTRERIYYFERITELTSRWLFGYYSELMPKLRIDLKTGKKK